MTMILAAAIKFTATAGVVADPAASLLATLSVALLLAHYAVRLRIAVAQHASGPLGWRWRLIMPLAVLGLPFAHIITLRHLRTLSPTTATATHDSGPVIKPDGTGPGRLPPTPPT
ncbi:hypothetical protein BH23ACT9_BH23ACT9_33510 [soil metagenome]